METIVIIFFALNLVFVPIGYYRKIYKTAMLNAFAAGLMLGAILYNF